MINMDQHNFAHVEAQLTGRFGNASVQHQTGRPGIQVEQQSIVTGEKEGPKTPEDDQSNVIRQNSETQADDQSNVMEHEAEIPSDDRSRIIGHEEEPSVDDQSNMMGEEEEPASRLEMSKCYANKGTQTDSEITLFSTGPRWHKSFLRLSREAAVQAGKAATRTGYHAFESSNTPVVTQKIRRCHFSGFLWHWREQVGQEEFFVGTRSESVYFLVFSDMDVEQG
ncbi:hypothetical protein ABVK25_003510 [Lepraria finkii]|uniref:Uncharacterized protein n=1 Tax=Lepraria finkii TaxID=1340010 RepID=A0ABR4BF72_9LECA